MAHIILIEPDKMLAETYCRSLISDGHTVVPCASAQAAILAADQTRPDIVLLELQLIEHSGIEFMYEFRSYTDWQTIPVLILSNVPPSEFAQNAKLLKHQLGIEDYLYKPQTSLGQLKKRVNACLSVAAA